MTEEIKVTSSKQFTIYIPKECDLNDCNLVVIRGREFVPVIRCKDCQWYEIAELKADGTEDRRFNPSWCELWKRHMHQQDYCSYAEWRIEDDRRLQKQIDDI